MRRSPQQILNIIRNINTNRSKRAKNLGTKTLYYGERIVERHAPRSANAHYIEEGLKTVNYLNNPRLT